MKIRTKLALLGLCLVALAIAISVVWRKTSAHCFLTAHGELRVCHRPSDEGMFYDTPTNEVAYNVQVLRLALDQYTTVYHAEPYRGEIRAGDALRVGLQDGPFTYRMPPSGLLVHGTTKDRDSELYNGVDADNPMGASGGANPMVIGGKEGDQYKYIFFLGVKGGSAAEPGAWRHHLLEARTVDFRAIDILGRSGSGARAWIPFGGPEKSPGRRPLVVKDTAGQTIDTNLPERIDRTQGLIGSIVRLGETYYFFYTDMIPNDPQRRMHLYYRTATNLSRADVDAWSPAKVAHPAFFGEGTLIRVAKAKAMDRWALVYTCYRPTDHRSDLCVQYTQDLSVESARGIAGAELFDANGNTDAYLGLKSGQGSRQQPYFMTDLEGALTTPTQEGKGPERGAFLTWLDLVGQAIYGAKVYWAGWDVERLGG